MDKNLKCCPDDKEMLATDEVCGNFQLACGTSDFLVWDTDEVVPLGTVSIFYLSGCADTLTVTVTNSDGQTDTFEVPPRNTRSRTYANLVSVSLACSTGAGTFDCEGRYCLDLHYLIPDSV
ncbi:DUF3992 domain-containing protein [Gracilibacillus sp. HCP3S3_G5_1]|uniref:DUF3992 domain-containing protein n=1 Tax=unclassified Gracilibacillus TaxID=2625209 RepID=UPI003F8A2325